jgi:hypothetical protein
MLHAKVLEIFGGVPVLNTDPHALMKASGYVDIRFPDMFQAAAWAKIWADESGDRPPVYTSGLMRVPVQRLSDPVLITVTDLEGG